MGKIKSAPDNPQSYWKEEEPRILEPEVFSLNPKYIVWAKYRKDMHIESNDYFRRGRYVVQVYFHDGRLVDFEVPNEQSGKDWVGALQAKFMRL